MGFGSFEEATEFVKNSAEMGKKCSNHEKLECYGLYKQATIGDVNIGSFFPANLRGV